MKRLYLSVLGVAAALMMAPGIAEAGKYSRAAASPCANGQCPTPQVAAAPFQGQLVAVAPTYANVTQTVTVKQRYKASGRRYGLVAVPMQVQAVQPVQASPQAPAKMQPARPTSYIRQVSTVAERPQEAQAEQPQAQPAAATADPYGFVSWLNGVRAQYGLGGVWYDENLSGWAATNSANGYSHAIRAGRRQNVGWGAAAQVWPMWLASAPHRVAILDPSITRAGIAYVNGVWTFNGD